MSGCSSFQLNLDLLCTATTDHLTYAMTISSQTSCQIDEIKIKNSWSAVFAEFIVDMFL